MSEAITMDLIKELRERTGVGMSKCKEALVLSEGDMEKAIDHLRKTGMAAGVKKEGRETKEGIILTKEDEESLIVAEANVETDFVAQNERFVQFLQDVLDQALKAKPESLEALMALPYEKDPSITLDGYRNLVIQALGENIQMRRFEVLPKGSDRSFGVYSHMGGKLVVIVEIAGASDEQAMAKELGMHIAAESPEYLNREEIPAEVIAREEDVARSQVKGKPENIVEKILTGKIKAFSEQVCLLNQKYVKDSSKTVEAVLQEHGKSAGKTLSIRRFLRWQVGQ